MTSERTPIATVGSLISALDYGRPRTTAEQVQPTAPPARSEPHGWKSVRQSCTNRLSLILSGGVAACALVANFAAGEGFWFAVERFAGRTEKGVAEEVYSFCFGSLVNLSSIFPCALGRLR